MNILYNLYYNCNKFKVENTKKLLSAEMELSGNAKICFNKFKEGVNMCKNEYDKEFCNELNEFLLFYSIAMYRKRLYKKIELKSLPELQSFNDLYKENPQISTNTPCKNINNNVLINTPRRKNEYDIILKRSTEDDMYKKLSESAVDVTICAEHCKNLISIENNNEKIKALCGKLATNLRKLNTVTIVRDNHKDKCSNLKYWTYDQIFDIFSTKKNYTNNSSIINEINQVIFRVNEELDVDEKCVFYVDVSDKDWDKERDLHYYFLNFDRLSTVKDNDAEHKKYCEYLKYICDIYMENVKKCCARYVRPSEHMQNKCLYYFNCDKKYYPLELMTKLKCENIEYKESVKDIFDSITIDLNVVRYSILMNSFKQIINITDDPFYLFVLSVFGILGFFLYFYLL
ncbi:CYIR protein [Plasmodium cynomolgi strain B]|uniref:CYIR protein n=1 Tax=Plasmodium cynomolgi (strain B) TaxID=1120755 RepID=K6UNS3_PLACD|nr:CYIR protein [Plasmodium cynomolgi strain B]GAB69758.1 CYIR protein [Plasmodium cynomolgi strain B]